MRRLRVAVMLAVIVAGCASGATTPGPNDGSSLDFEHVKGTIVVDDGGIQVTFDNPPIRVGDALTVVNRGTKDHGLTSKTIDTGTMRPGESTTVFLTETGSIDVRDRADLSHTAHIDVAPKAGS